MFSHCLSLLLLSRIKKVSRFKAFVNAKFSGKSNGGKKTTPTETFTERLSSLDDRMFKGLTSLTRLQFDAPESATRTAYDGNHRANWETVLAMYLVNAKYNMEEILMELTFGFLSTTAVRYIESARKAFSNGLKT